MAPNSIGNYLHLVIRSADERTEGLCRELFSQQVGSSNVSVIHESPFAVAHRKSLELGIQAGKEWTVIVDADLLPAEGVIEELLVIAESSPSSVFELHTKALDKFFGGVRYVGIKFYRTTALPEAINYIPEAGSALRPESHMIKQMVKQGHWNLLTEVVAGLHDFEQYYKDIFRKGYTHGIKFDSFSQSLSSYWERQSNTDLDFLILLKGYELGQTRKNQELMLDKNEVTTEFAAVLQQVGLEEKQPLADGDLSAISIKQQISVWKEPEEFLPIKKHMLENLPPQPDLIVENLIDYGRTSAQQKKLDLLALLSPGILSRIFNKFTRKQFVHSVKSWLLGTGIRRKMWNSYKRFRRNLAIRQKLSRLLKSSQLRK